MALDRETLRQIETLLKPLATRITNGVARAVVELANDGPKLQLLQVGVLAGETIDSAEHFQPYGFSSIPLGGAEAVLIFAGSDRSHPIVVAVSDRRYRPTGGEPGEVTVYNHTGAKITMTKDGDIEVQPAAGREVYIRDAGGVADRLVKKSEHDGHTHGPGSFVTPAAGGGGGPVSGVSGGAAPVTGTARLKAQ